MFGLKRHAAVLVLVTSALMPGMALACACCADPGQRAVSTQSLDGYVAGVFDGLQFGPIATVFVDPCGLECVDGIENPDYSYDLMVDRRDGGLTFALAGKETQSRGVLALRLPETLESFVTDMAPDPATMSPILYKEWRMQVPIQGEGAFSKLPSAGVISELVLIGRGNSCDSDADFTHWMLDVSGEGVDFRLFGGLSP